jgi:predicted NUDIX family NTP pyrophosphohydrolase
VKKSAGLLVYYLSEGEIFVLIVHSNTKSENEPWSIPKGEFNFTDETPEHAAIREVEEEIGLTVPEAELTSLGQSTYRNKKKRVYCFAWHAGSKPKMKPDPYEVSIAEFCQLGEARQRLHQDQLIFLDRLAEFISF